MRRILGAVWLMACAAPVSAQQQGGRYQFFSVNAAHSYVLDTQTGRTWVIGMAGCTPELKRSLPPMDQCGFEALQTVPYASFGGADETGQAKIIYQDLPPATVGR